MTFALTSTAFAEGAPIPVQYTCDGADVSPPLACGGADDPSNMQWQTTAEGKAKDKLERQGCGSKR